METPEIIELKEFYSNHKDEFPQIYSFLKTTLKWRETHPEYITVFSVQGDWRNDGTFIAILTVSYFLILLVHTHQLFRNKVNIHLKQGNH